MIDNPPFSILKEICSYYNERGIKYVLFCPALTSIKSYSKGTCYVKELITYENGAKIPTAFTHNFSDALETAPELNAKLKEIASTEKKKSLPKYIYPPEVVTPFTMMNIANGGMHYKIDKWEIVKALDSQKPYKKAIFGGAALVSKRKAEEAKRKVEEAKRKVEEAKRKPIEWKLSDREETIVDKLGESDG